VRKCCIHDVRKYILFHEDVLSLEVVSESVYKVVFGVIVTTDRLGSARKFECPGIATKSTNCYLRYILSVQDVSSAQD
jgi:hypothetical protein